jgi:hypothetical protein
VSDECSDALSEPRTEQGGRESRHFHSALHGFMLNGVVPRGNNSGKVGVVWRSPVIKNASLPESDADASPNQVDGTARTGQADTQAHHSLTGLTACVQTGVPARGILPPVMSARPTPCERKPRRSRRGGCHNLRTEINAIQVETESATVQAVRDCGTTCRQEAMTD